MTHFRNYTKGKWLLLGRRTFEEMRGWFNDSHTPLVLTSQCGWDPPVGRVVSSVPHALALAKTAGQDEIVCCGGAQTYTAALPFAHKLVLTIVQHEFPPDHGAVYFPDWDRSEWRTIMEETHPMGPGNEHEFRVISSEHIQR